MSLGCKVCDNCRKKLAELPTVEVNIKFTFHIHAMVTVMHAFHSCLKRSIFMLFKFSFERTNICRIFNISL